MTREHAPTTVICAGCDRKDVPAYEVREAQITWCKPFKRFTDPRDRNKGGTHSDPQELFRTQVYLCASCWAGRKGKIRSRFLFGFLDRVSATLRQLVKVWLAPPVDVTFDIFGDQRATEDTLPSQVDPVEPGIRERAIADMRRVLEGEGGGMDDRRQRSA